jgi:outer membrane protein assembly factor BamA
MRVAATPARGTYRPNPALGAGTYTQAKLALRREAAGVAVRHDLSGEVAVEGGTGPTDYLRGAVGLRWRAPLGPGDFRLLAYGGIGTDGLPAYRSFVMGGRGTLVGYPFRAYGGRSLGVAQAEWRFQLPAPAIPLGTFASTGRTFVLAPFIGAGWSERAVAGTPWMASDGLRSTAGLATEWFMGLLRVEGGVGLRDGLFEVTVDVSREWWNIL